MNVIDHVGKHTTDCSNGPTTAKVSPVEYPLWNPGFGQVENTDCKCVLLAPQQAG